MGADQPIDVRELRADVARRLQRQTPRTVTLTGEDLTNLGAALTFYGEHGKKELTGVSERFDFERHVIDLADKLGVMLGRWHRTDVAIPRAAKPAAVVLDCMCLVSCASDPLTRCSLSGQWHTHPDDGTGVYGPCPVHPDAPGDK